MAAVELILLQRVENLGQMGDVVKVKPGYARNFLLPQKKALRASKDNRARFDQQRAQLEAQNIRRREEAERLAERGTQRGELINKKGRTAEEETLLAKIDADLVVAGEAFQQFLSKLETELGSSANAGSKIFGACCSDRLNSPRKADIAFRPAK